LQSSLEEEHLQHPLIPAQSLILQSSLEEEEQSCSILSTTKSRAAKKMFRRTIRAEFSSPKALIAKTSLEEEQQLHPLQYKVSHCKLV
jgi:hypothetical protein